MIPAQTESLEGRHERIGTGDFLFSDISFYDNTLKQCERIFSGQDLVIGLKYITRPENIGAIRDMNLAVVFKNDKGQRLFGTPSEVLPMALPEELPREGEYLLKISKLPLLPGIYDLDLGCIINRLTTDKLVSAKRLVVNEADFFGSGKLPSSQMGDILVHFGNEWR